MLKTYKLRYPVYMLMLINIFGFLLLYIRKVPFDNNILITGGILSIGLPLIYWLIRKLHLGDPYLFMIVAMLFSIGIIMIFRLDSKIGIKQAIWFGIGVGLFFISYAIFRWFKWWDRLVWVYFGATFVLSAATMVLGRRTRGASNWIYIGGVSIQASEIMRILFVFIIACYYSQRKQLMKRFPKLWVNAVFMVMCYTVMGLLILQKEWGTTLVLFLVLSGVLYVCEKKPWLLLINAAAALAGGYAGATMIYHIRVRVDIWLDPWSDIARKGYQIAQSLFAIGSGGFFGTGIGLGKPYLIPDVHTDFIFAAICEEMGIFGGCAVILLYFLLCYRAFKIVLNTRGRFVRTLALGITLMFAFQTFIIIGGVTKLIPLTGIVMPFISYGGSSLVTNFIALGILLAISGTPAWVTEGDDMDENEDENEDEDKDGHEHEHEPEPESGTAAVAHTGTCDDNSSTVNNVESEEEEK